VALYSAGLGVFVPSGGSKWVIIAPYVMGYTTLVFFVLTPVVLALVTLFGATLPYPL